jgi:drug/metabolite transporter (DMT)-like permease
MDGIIVAPPRSDYRACAAAAITVVLWASSFVVVRSAVQDFSPTALALGRLLVGAVVLGAILLFRGEGWPPRAAWPGIAGSGVLWFGLYMLTLNWGTRQVDAGTAAMLVNTAPMLIALLSGWLLKEGFPPRLLGGIGVAFLGSVLVGLSITDGGRGSVTGVLLCLVAAVSHAGATVSQKPALRHASALQVTTFGCLVGTTACLPFAGQLVSEISDVPWSATLHLLYLGIFPTALAYTAWSYALARTPAGQMGATAYLVPALAVVLSWVLLDEVPGFLALIGGLLCLSGVVVARGGKVMNTTPRHLVIAGETVTADRPAILELSSGPRL